MEKTMKLYVNVKTNSLNSKFKDELQKFAKEDKSASPSITCEQDSAVSQNLLVAQ